MDFLSLQKWLQDGSGRSNGGGGGGGKAVHRKNRESLKKHEDRRKGAEVMQLIKASQLLIPLQR